MSSGPSSVETRSLSHTRGPGNDETSPSSSPRISEVSPGKGRRETGIYASTPEDDMLNSPRSTMNTASYRYRLQSPKENEEHCSDGSDGVCVDMASGVCAESQSQTTMEQQQHQDAKQELGSLSLDGSISPPVPTVSPPQPFLFSRPTTLQGGPSRRQDDTQPDGWDDLEDNQTSQTNRHAFSPWGRIPAAEQPCGKWRYFRDGQQPPASKNSVWSGLEKENHVADGLLTQRPHSTARRNNSFSEIATGPNNIFSGGRGIGGDRGFSVSESRDGSLSRSTVVIADGIRLEESVLREDVGGLYFSSSSSDWVSRGDYVRSSGVSLPTTLSDGSHSFAFPGDDCQDLGNSFIRAADYGGDGIANSPIIDRSEDPNYPTSGYCSDSEGPRVHGTHAVSTNAQEKGILLRSSYRSFKGKFGAHELDLRASRNSQIRGGEEHIALSARSMSGVGLEYERRISSGKWVVHKRNKRAYSHNHPRDDWTRSIGVPVELATEWTNYLQNAEITDWTPMSAVYFGVQVILGNERNRRKSSSNSHPTPREGLSRSPSYSRENSGFSQGSPVKESSPSQQPTLEGSGMSNRFAPLFNSTGVDDIIDARLRSEENDENYEGECSAPDGRAARSQRLCTTKKDNSVPLTPMDDDRCLSPSSGMPEWRSNPSVGGSCAPAEPGYSGPLEMESSQEQERKPTEKVLSLKVISPFTQQQSSGIIIPREDRSDVLGLLKRWVYKMVRTQRRLTKHGLYAYESTRKTFYSKPLRSKSLNYASEMESNTDPVGRPLDALNESSVYLGCGSIHVDSSYRIISVLETRPHCVSLLDVCAFSRQLLSEKELTALMWSVVSALQRIHDAGVRHGALHGGNVLCSADNGHTVLTQAGGCMSNWYFPNDPSFLSPWQADYLKPYIPHLRDTTPPSSPTDTNPHTTADVKHQNPLIDDMENRIARYMRGLLGARHLYEPQERDDYYALAMLMITLLVGVPPHLGSSLPDVVDALTFTPPSAATRTTAEPFRRRWTSRNTVAMERVGPKAVGNAKASLDAVLRCKYTKTRFLEAGYSEAFVQAAREFIHICLDTSLVVETGRGSRRRSTRKESKHYKSSRESGNTSKPDSTVFSEGCLEDTTTSNKSSARDRDIRRVEHLLSLPFFAWASSVEEDERVDTIHRAVYPVVTAMENAVVACGTKPFHVRLMRNSVFSSRMSALHHTLDHYHFAPLHWPAGNRWAAVKMSGTQASLFDDMDEERSIRLLLKSWPTVADVRELLGDGHIALPSAGGVRGLTGWFEPSPPYTCSHVDPKEQSRSSKRVGQSTTLHFTDSGSMPDTSARQQQLQDEEDILGPHGDYASEESVMKRQKWRARVISAIRAKISLLFPVEEKPRQQPTQTSPAYSHSSPLRQQSPTTSIATSPLPSSLMPSRRTLSPQPNALISPVQIAADCGLPPGFSIHRDLHVCLCENANYTNLCMSRESAMLVRQHADTLVLRDITGCRLEILAPFRFIVVLRVKRCELLLGPSIACLCQDVSDCSPLAVATSKLLLENIGNVCFNTFVVNTPHTTKPESIVDVSFSPYSVSYPGLSADWASVSLPQEHDATVFHPDDDGMPCVSLLVDEFSVENSHASRSAANSYSSETARSLQLNKVWNTSPIAAKSKGRGANNRASDPAWKGSDHPMRNSVPETQYYSSYACNQVSLHRSGGAHGPRSTATSSSYTHSIFPAAGLGASYGNADDDKVKQASPNEIPSPVAHDDGSPKRDQKRCVSTSSDAVQTYLSSADSAVGTTADASHDNDDSDIDGNDGVKQKVVPPAMDGGVIYSAVQQGQDAADERAVETDSQVDEDDEVINEPVPREMLLLHTDVVGHDYPYLHKVLTASRHLEHRDDNVSDVYYYYGELDERDVFIRNIHGDAERNNLSGVEKNIKKKSGGKSNASYADVIFGERRAYRSRGAPIGKDDSNTDVVGNTDPKGEPSSTTSGIAADTNTKSGNPTQLARCSSSWMFAHARTDPVRASGASDDNAVGFIMRKYSHLEDDDEVHVASPETTAIVPSNDNSLALHEACMNPTEVNLANDDCKARTTAIVDEKAAEDALDALESAESPGHFAFHYDDEIEVMFDDELCEKEAEEPIQLKAPTKGKVSTPLTPTELDDFNDVPPYPPRATENAESEASNDSVVEEPRYPTIFILDVVGDCVIEDCSKATILVVGSKDAVVVRRCHQIRLVIVAQQLVVEECSMMEVFGFVTEGARFTDCVRIDTYPLFLVAPDTDAIIERVLEATPDEEACAALLVAYEDRRVEDINIFQMHRSASLLKTVTVENCDQVVNYPDVMVVIHVSIPHRNEKTSEADDTGASGIGGEEGEDGEADLTTSPTINGVTRNRSKGANASTTISSNATKRLASFEMYTDERTQSSFFIEALERLKAMPVSAEAIAARSASAQAENTEGFSYHKVQHHQQSLKENDGAAAGLSHQPRHIAFETFKYGYQPAAQQYQNLRPLVSFRNAVDLRIVRPSRSLHVRSDAELARGMAPYSEAPPEFRAECDTDVSCDMIIDHLQLGFLHVDDAVGTLRIRHCKGPINIIVCAAQNVIVESCENITLQVACFTFLAVDCRSCHMALHVNTQPRYCQCANVVTSALNIAAVNLEYLFERAAVQEDTNLFSKPVIIDISHDENGADGNNGASTTSHRASPTTSITGDEWARRFQKEDNPHKFCPAGCFEPFPRAMSTVDVSGSTSGAIWRNYVVDVYSSQALHKDVLASHINSLTDAFCVLRRPIAIVPPLPGVCVGESDDLPFMEILEERVTQEVARLPLERHLTSALYFIGDFNMDDTVRFYCRCVDCTFKKKMMKRLWRSQEHRQAMNSSIARSMTAVSKNGLLLNAHRTATNRSTSSMDNVQVELLCEPPSTSVSTPTQTDLEAPVRNWMHGSRSNTDMMTLSEYGEASISGTSLTTDGFPVPSNLEGNGESREQEWLGPLEDGNRAMTLAIPMANPGASWQNDSRTTSPSARYSVSPVHISRRTRQFMDSRYEHDPYACSKDHLDPGNDGDFSDSSPMSTSIPMLSTASLRKRGIIHIDPDDIVESSPRTVAASMPRSNASNQGTTDPFAMDDNEPDPFETSLHPRRAAGRREGQWQIPPVRRATALPTRAANDLSFHFEEVTPVEEPDAANDSDTSSPPSSRSGSSGSSDYSSSSDGSFEFVVEDEDTEENAGSGMDASSDEEDSQVEVNGDDEDGSDVRGTSKEGCCVEESDNHQAAEAGEPGYPAVSFFSASSDGAEAPSTEQDLRLTYVNSLTASSNPPGAGSIRSCASTTAHGSEDDTVAIEGEFSDRGSQSEPPRDTPSISSDSGLISMSFKGRARSTDNAKDDDCVVINDCSSADRISLPNSVDDDAIGESVVNYEDPANSVDASPNESTSNAYIATASSGEGDGEPDPVMPEITDSPGMLGYSDTSSELDSRPEKCTSPPTLPLAGSRKFGRRKSASSALGYSIGRTPVRTAFGANDMRELGSINPAEPQRFSFAGAELRRDCKVASAIEQERKLREARDTMLARRHSVGATGTPTANRCTTPTPLTNGKRMNGEGSPTIN